MINQNMWVIMKSITQYKVLSSDNLQELQSLVNKELKQGWQPLGGISTGAESDGDCLSIIYMQSMVKLQDPEIYL